MCLELRLLKIRIKTTLALSLPAGECRLVLAFTLTLPTPPPPLTVGQIIRTRGDRAKLNIYIAAVNSAPQSAISGFVRVISRRIPGGKKDSEVPTPPQSPLSVTTGHLSCVESRVWKI